MATEGTQSYQASATLGITVLGRNGTDEVYVSASIDRKIVAKGSDPTAITAADSTAQLNTTPYTTASRLFDCEHAPSMRVHTEFDTAADRTATVQPVYYDASSNVIGVGEQTYLLATKKVGSTVLLDEATGHALGGDFTLDVAGACKVGFIVHALSGGSLYIFAYPI